MYLQSSKICCYEVLITEHLHYLLLNVDEGVDLIVVEYFNCTDFYFKVLSSNQLININE